MSKYNSKHFKLYGVPENFMEVIDYDLYVPTDMQDVTGVGDLPNGKVNAVGLLYSNDDFTQYPGYNTPDNDMNQDPYDIGVQEDLDAARGRPTWTIKMLLPEGLASVYAIEAASVLEMKTQYYNSDSDDEELQN